jgi:hypothetical protein
MSYELTPVNFFDGHTRRPNWANPLTYEVEDVPAPQVWLRDTPWANRPQEITRSLTATGYIVPVSTAGRGTANVPARSLRGTALDRGHLLALSLGGPDLGYNVVPQPFAQNRRVHNVLDHAHMSALLWREFEIYIQWCAERGLRNEGGPPGPDDPIDFRLSRQTGRPVASINGTRLQPPRPADYANLPNPAYGVYWAGTVTYWRGNSARRITIDVEAHTGNQRQPIASREFTFQDRIGDFRLLDRRNDDFQDKMNERKLEMADALEYRAEHLRQRGDDGRVIVR